MGTSDFVKSPPILWIPFRLDLKWISRFFQLYFSDFHFPHFRAPPICDFGSAHWKKQNICRVFPLYLSDFNVCIFELFIHYPVRTSHVDCLYYKWKQINVLELWEFQVHNPTCSKIDVQAALREGHHLAAPGKWIMKNEKWKQGNWSSLLKILTTHSNGFGESGESV